MYLVTLFRIDSEIRFQDAVSQEIDHRVVKGFDRLEDAQKYIETIKNRLLMFNFPFAIVQYMTQDGHWKIHQQWLYSYDDVAASYISSQDMTCLTLATRRKLHDFEEDVQLEYSH